MKKELPACPVETTLMLISNRWNVLILRDLMEGTKRFGGIKKITGKYLTKSIDSKFKSHGRKRTINQNSICPSASLK